MGEKLKSPILCFSSYFQLVFKCLTLHVIQLLYVADYSSGADVQPVTVAKVPHDVFGVEGRRRVVNQLREAQRAHRGDFKPTALEGQEEEEWARGCGNMHVRVNIVYFSVCVFCFFGQTWKVRRSMSVQEKSYNKHSFPSKSFW